ncbi:hypothetical protein BDW74DRAFT_176208 [Aspergillus multicolor]|uniref:uncharacterized protein n=1 Tax=Aspergillus multicolor TaxID=41759 RepID=UPI003CCCC33F
MPIKWTPDTDKLLLIKIIETHDLKLDAKRVADAWPGTIEGQDKPTPRAIQERLVRIRADIKASSQGKGSLSIGAVPKSSPSTSTPRKTRKPATPTSTPESGKRRKTANTLSKSSPLKREMNIDDDASLADADHELDHDFGASKPGNSPFSTPTKTGKGRGLFDIPAHPGTPATSTLTPPALSPRDSLDALAARAGTSLGLDLKKEDGVVGDRSPVKRTPRARRAVSALNMVSYNEHFADDEDDQEASSSEDYTPDGAVFEDDDDFA